MSITEFYILGIVFFLVKKYYLCYVKWIFEYIMIYIFIYQYGTYW